MKSNSIIIEHLVWDSNFLQIKTGRVDVFSDIDLDVVLFSAKKENYNLLYIYCNNILDYTQKALTLYGGKLADVKLIFSKVIKENNLPIHHHIYDIAGETLNDNTVNKLYELAYQSGKHSRFKLDENIGEDKFKMLYENWINNSLNLLIASNFYILNNHDEILGLLTLKKNLLEKSAKIGLLSVSKNHRSKGIGSELILKSESNLLNEGINKFIVETQEKNTTACKFYLKNNFKLLKTEYIYHFWIN